MKTLENFKNREVKKSFTSKILGGGDPKPVLTTNGNNPAPFENLTITVEVKGTGNRLLVKAAGEETTQTTTTGDCSTSNGTVTCETR